MFYPDSSSYQRRATRLLADASVDLRPLGQRCCHGDQVSCQRGLIEAEPDVVFLLTWNKTKWGDEGDRRRRRSKVFVELLQEASADSPSPSELRRRRTNRFWTYFSLIHDSFSALTGRRTTSFSLSCVSDGKPSPSVLDRTRFTADCRLWV